MAILISALSVQWKKKTLFSAAASTKNLKTPRKCVVVPQVARRAIIPERKSANLAAQLKAQVQLRAQKNKGPARSDRGCALVIRNGSWVVVDSATGGKRCLVKARAGVTWLPKIFLRPWAEVQGGAKIQSVVSRSIVAKVHDTLQNLVRDLVRQDVPYVVPHCILHLCPSQAASQRITDER